jgi:hypothetical protein
MTDVPVFQRKDVRQIPVRDMPPIPLGLIWCTARENAKIRALADVAREMGLAGAGAGSRGAPVRLPAGRRWRGSPRTAGRR